MDSGQAAGVNENDLSEDEDEHGLSESSTVETTAPLQPNSYARFRRKFVAMKNFLLQTDDDDNFNSEYVPNHRMLPIISGIVIPFSILLEIPGLTEHWYIITENNVTVSSRKNSVLLDVGLSISMACALIANLAIISRFLEKKVRTSTLIAIGALSIHDIVNIVAVTIFGVIHRFDDGFTYGQSFWFTVCSTIASFLTNITLIVDYVRTPDFAQSSSGLTRKQRSLLIVVMLLLVWIAIGGLVNSLLMDLSFINGMYFTVAVIETIGFGDIVPRSPGARIFTGLHGILGILNLALVIGTCRDTVIEGFEVAYRKHLNTFSDRHKARVAHRHEKHVRKETIKKQLKGAGLPIYVKAIGISGVFKSGMRTLHLNEKALTQEQKTAAALEAEEILNGPDEMNIGRRSTLLSQLSIKNEATKRFQKEFVVKLTIVWSLFLTFWLIGSAIFMATEGWSYGGAMWFCFESFTTIGFGDRTPDTPAGRSVFIVWALLGVGAMTILISVLSEAFSSRYQSAIQAHASHTIDMGAVKIAEAMPEPKPMPDSLQRKQPEHMDSHWLPRRSVSCPHIRECNRKESIEVDVAGATEDRRTRGQCLRGNR
ncbi:hypothetical protein EW145_g1213 [Phellinidium pouzarii]|uniref:Potassium channel domain-containing protein n=1 Tax=Phellinidium pouzarii TaxID=167371 RepID=A0A4S4LFF9_9AGAM|nr:hypothetical protein EW145_g1213 [Phellinidium pouzarii]